MLDGEWLYERLAFHLQVLGMACPPWPQISPWHQAYEATMREILYRIAMQASGAIDATPSINWRETVRKYGRHAPNCSTSAPCTCGFADIEKLLT